MHQSFLFPASQSEEREVFISGLVGFTVEQEIFTTGKFREFAASGGSRQENFANVKHYIFTTGNFRESADFRENLEIFLHAKFSCFTVWGMGIYGFRQVSQLFGGLTWATIHKNNTFISTEMAVSSLIIVRI